jgi:hypothetical protein
MAFWGTIFSTFLRMQNFVACRDLYHIDRSHQLICKLAYSPEKAGESARTEALGFAES